MEQMDGNVESDDEDGFDDGDADDADEGGEDGDEDEDDEDDEETLEKKAKIRQFASEIKQLEMAIEKKRAGFQGGNPIMIVSS
jgi:transcription initiation factor TFIID subunit 7